MYIEIFEGSVPPTSHLFESIIFAKHNFSINIRTGEVSVHPAICRGICTSNVCEYVQNTLLFYTGVHIYARVDRYTAFYRKGAVAAIAQRDDSSLRNIYGAVKVVVANRVSPHVRESAMLEELNQRLFATTCSVMFQIFVFGRSYWL